jgi:hypothetical protein
VIGYVLTLFAALGALALAASVAGSVLWVGLRLRELPVVRPAWWPRRYRGRRRLLRSRS